MDKVTTICYKQERVWESRKDAIDFFTEGVMACEGAEQSRYATILAKLMSGQTACSDQPD